MALQDTELWWPVGYGDQKLYQVQLQCRTVISTELATRDAKIGFRTAYIDQSYLNEDSPELGVLEVKTRKLYV